MMLVIAWGAGATLTSCDVSGVIGPGDVRRFAKAKLLWDSRPFTDYTYEIRTDCFCPPEVTQWARVEVKNGTVVDVDAVVPNANYPITTTSFWQPIDSLFSDIHRAMSTGSFSSAYSAINVTYDAQLGFPTSIEYVSKPTVADAGALISVRNVIPLPGVPVLPAQSSRFLVPAEKDD